MQNKKFVKAGLLTLFLLLAFIISWESYLRGKGINVAYDDGGKLWGYKRSLVYQPLDQATVFIGPSRMKYDLDINTWRKLTGQDAVQLAIEGESPMYIFDDLAADEKFKGRLVVDVTEGLLFTTNQASLSTSKKYIEQFRKTTPSEKLSFHLNRGLESQFVFLDQNEFSLGAYLEKLDVPNRAGVFAIPNRWPMEFGRISFDRQDIMMDRFLTDTNLQKKVTGNWQFFASIDKEPPASGNRLDSFLRVIKNNCDRIKARGGQVLFVRTPSSAWYWEGEQKFFPREKYWDRLLAETNCTGVHFKDYPAIDHFVCPEWSHLAPKDAIIFTENLVKILEAKGLKFKNKATP